MTSKLLVVNRKDFAVILYDRPDKAERFDVVAEYPCAIGAKGYGTHPGLYVVHEKAKDPDWKVPDSQWAIDAGLTPGVIIPAGPDNPIKARWLGFTADDVGIGIHGTDAYWSIGSRASHGCVRMLVDDVIKLHSEVPLFTPVIVL